VGVLCNCEKSLFNDRVKLEPLNTVDRFVIALGSRQLVAIIPPGMKIRPEGFTSLYKWAFLFYFWIIGWTIDRGRNTTMNHQQLIELGLSYEGTSLRYPFTPDLPVLYVRERMFALLGQTEGVESVNLKTSPHEAWFQRETYAGAVLPGYHMNKQHWNTVILNGEVPDDVIVVMFQESYQRVVAKLPKADRDVLRLPT